MKPKTLTCLLIAVVGLAGCMRDSDHLMPNTKEGNFEALWRIIDERYCFVDEKGVDWDRIGEEYRRKLAGIDDGDEIALFDLMASMLDSLRDGHVNLITPFDYSSNASWRDSFPDNFDANLINDHYLQRCRTAGGMRYTVLPDSLVGYIRYASFSNAFSSTNLRYIFSSMSRCKGVIVDVRSNGGGVITYATDLASVFMPEETTVGYMRHKTGRGHADYSDYTPMTVPRASLGISWQRPVAVLTNRGCYSATNYLANCMRYAPRAVLVGDTTGGGSGMPLSYELPNGWMVRFSAVPMYDADSCSTELGVAPAIRVNCTDTAALNGRDDIIEAARQWIVEF